MFHRDNLHFQKWKEPLSSLILCRLQLPVCETECFPKRTRDFSNSSPKNRQKKKIKIRHKLPGAESPETSRRGGSTAVISRVSSRKNSTPPLSSVKLYYGSQVWKLY